MTQDEKQLLLKDICGRLSYNVVIRCTDNDTDYKCFLTTNILNELLHNTEYYDYKPYLRPMSSMTEEERKEYCNLQDIFLCSSQYPVTDAYKLFDWLLEHHFDFRHLIEKGLALEATEDMYKEKWL